MENGKKENIIVRGLGVSDYILIVSYLILIIPWTAVVVKHFSATNMASELLNIKLQAMLCYICPYLIMLAVVVVGIVRIFQHLYYITWGTFAMAVSGIVAVGQSIFNQLPTDTGTLIGKYVFNIYGEIWVISLIISIIVTICVYIRARID